MYKIIANVSYSKIGNPYHTIDYLLPDNTENIKGDNFGLHIHYHGGTWGESEIPFSQGGDKNEQIEVTLAKHAAYIVSNQDPDGTIIALVNYRLSGEVSLTDMYNDVITSFKHILNDTIDGGLNVNQTKISISGAGSGAHLVACMVSRPFDLKKTFLNLINDVILYGLPGNLNDYKEISVNPYGLIWNWTKVSSSGLEFSPEGAWFNSWVKNSELIDYNPKTLMEGFRGNINFTPRFNLHMFHGRNDITSDVRSAIEFLTAYKKVSGAGSGYSDESEIAIQELYIAYFGRPADPSGFKYWLDSLSNGVTITSIANAFAASEEWQVINALNTNDFLILIYQQCFGRGYNVKTPPSSASETSLQKLYIAWFGRPADPEGLIYWGLHLDSGSTTINDIATNFGVHSPSILALNTNDFLILIYQQAFSRVYNPGLSSNNPVSSASETLLQELYIAWYGRPADPEGLSFYGNALDNGSTTINDIAFEFANSSEGQIFINLGTNAFLSAVYLQSFSRGYDNAVGADGTFWYDAIESGATTKELAMVQILQGAGGSDYTALSNKVIVAKTYTEAVTNDNKIYSGNIAALEASFVIDRVTSDSSTVSPGNTAAQTAVDNLPFGNIVDGDNITTGAGVDGTFWYDAIESGATTKELAMVQILNGAQNADFSAMSNKVIVAKTYTEAVIDDNKDFSGASAISTSQSILAAVTSDSSTVSIGNTAAQTAVDALNSAPPPNPNLGPDGSYWFDQIESGEMPKGLAAANIIWGAQHSDSIAVQNKVTVARNFTSEIIKTNKDFSGASAISASKTVLSVVTSDSATVSMGNDGSKIVIDNLPLSDEEGVPVIHASMKIYENSGHALEGLYTDPTQQTDTLIPHPYTFPRDGSLSYTEENLGSITSLLSDFKAASASAPKFDYTNDPIMNMNIGGIPILDDNGDVTLSEGALKGCGVNMAIDFLDENLNKVLDKGKTIDKFTSALAWCSELQSLGDDIIGNIRGELNIPSISDITDSLPESIGSIAETAVKAGAIYESVQNGGLDISTLNNAMSVMNTDYGDALGSIGLDSNKIMSIVSGGDSISSILNGGSLCETMPNISKLASGEVLEILAPVELATKDIKPEMAKPEDIDIIASDNIKKELETELKPTNSLTAKNKEVTKSFVQNTNELIGISLGVTTKLKLELPISDNPRDFRENPTQMHYSITKPITDIAKNLDSGIPRSTPGLVDTDVGVQQLNSFVNNRSSDEDPRGASGNMIADMSNILTSGINFSNEELSNYTDPSSLINIIKSKLPNEDSTILPTGLLNFDDPNHEGVQKIKDIHEDEKINKFIAEKLNNNNNTRLNSYITQRRLNHLTTIDDDSIESMWKNDPYFNNDIIKEQSGYTDLEYRTHFSRSELIELFELYNQLQAELSE